LQEEAEIATTNTIAAAEINFFILEIILIKISNGIARIKLKINIYTHLITGTR